MIMIGLPPFLSPLAALLFALIGALTMSRARRPNIQPYDVEDRIADLTLKVRSPWQYKARRLERWMRGE